MARPIPLTLIHFIACSIASSAIGRRDGLRLRVLLRNLMIGSEPESRRSSKRVVVHGRKLRAILCGRLHMRRLPLDAIAENHGTVDSQSSNRFQSGGGKSIRQKLGAGSVNSMATSFRPASPPIWTTRLCRSSAVFQFLMASTSFFSTFITK